MLLSHNRATGWGRFVRVTLLLCALAMFAAAVSMVGEGTGGFTNDRHRMIARTIILVSATVAVLVAMIAWWRSRSAS